MKDDIAGIRQFIVDKKIVSLKSRDNLKVIATPPFMRGVYSVAGFHSAPPLDPNAEAEYWVTPIDPKTSQEMADSRLGEYNNWVLKWLTIHEALPGHYVQAEHSNEIQPLIESGHRAGDDRRRPGIRPLRASLSAVAARGEGSELYSTGSFPVGLVVEATFPSTSVQF